MLLAPIRHLETSVDALRLLLVTRAAFIDRRNEQIIAYLRAENEVLRVHFDGRRIPFTTRSVVSWLESRSRSAEPRSGRWDRS